MRQRGSSSGRAEGTDGSDFSYRMVVDSRYKKVAEEKSRLQILILIQAMIFVFGALYGFLKPSKRGVNTLVFSSGPLGLVSLSIGELGIKHSRVNVLRFYLLASSIAVILAMVSAVQRGTILEILQRPLNWETLDKLELLETARIIAGSLVQLLAIATASSLIGNMSPPKRAS